MQKAEKWMSPPEFNTVGAVRASLCSSTDAQLQLSCPGLSLPFCRHCCSQQLVQHQLMPTGHSECGCKLCLSTLVFVFGSESL